MASSEYNLQQACVTWFRLQYPALAQLLIHVPNGGQRGKVEAARFKRIGVTAGVSDLLLLVPFGTVGCLCIELKTSTGRQSEAQKIWQGVAEKHNKYIVVRDLEQFINEINNYLK